MIKNFIASRSTVLLSLIISILPATKRKKKFLFNSIVWLDWVCQFAPNSFEQCPLS